MGVRVDVNKKVLYNIKKIKKCWGGEGQYLNQNTLYVFKKEKEKKMTEPGFEPTTSGFEIH